MAIALMDIDCKVVVTINLANSSTELLIQVVLMNGCSSIFIEFFAIS